MERETGFEPATSTLARLHSTTELFPLRRAHISKFGSYFPKDLHQSFTVFNTGMWLSPSAQNTYEGGESYSQPAVVTESLRLAITLPLSSSNR